MKYDRRFLRVSVGHAQPRIKKPRVGVTTKGFNFLEGVLSGMFVSPITGCLQSMPNSEEGESSPGAGDGYQLSNSGRWAKFSLSDTTAVDNNSPTGTWQMAQAQGMHLSSSIYFVGENTAGAGRITNAALPQNTGLNLAQYVYGSGTDQDVLIEGGYGPSASSASGESFRVYLDGRIEIKRNGVLVGKGSFGGSGYQFGSAKGGSYVRPSDQYVQIRVEPYRDRYLLFTSSIGGVFQFECPWAVDQYAVDGTVSTPKAPITSANKAWFFVPKGGINVVWSKVQYVPSGSAISEEFALSEPPHSSTGVGAFSGKALPENSNVTVSLVSADGTSAFVDTQNRCRVKVVASSAPVWIDGTSTRYDPIRQSTVAEGSDGGGIDVSDFFRNFSFGVEDGPEGAIVRMSVRMSAPVDGLDEVENRPFKVELIPNPFDSDPQDPITLLDGVLSAPELEEGRGQVEDVVHFEGHDRLWLLKDAEVSETVTFDGSYLCRPYTPTTDSAVAVCLRQAGIDPATEADLPDLDFIIEHVPPQRAGDWSFEARAGEKWWDVLTALFDLAPSLFWGIKPEATGPKFFVIDPETPPATVGTLYRLPEDAAAGSAEVDGALGAFPALYGDHKRKKLPIEGNLVRVLGLDPATQKPITSTRSDDDSRDPHGAKDGLWLGSTRTVKFKSPTLNSQPMCDRTADSLLKAVSQRSYVEPWRSFMVFKDDGSPLWRGDRITLDGAIHGTDPSVVFVSSLQPEFRDENGGGLMDDSGPLAPVSVRLCNYTGGALVGLGGVGANAIESRHRRRIEEGGWRGRGSELIPSISPVGGTILSV